MAEPPKPSRPKTVALEQDGGTGGTADLPTLPGFEPVAELGSGGQGVVVKALQTDLQREVVLKFLRPEYVGHGSMRRRFFQEALVTSKLTHPNVVKVLAVDESRGAIVYEFVPGETLAGILSRKGPLDPMDAARYCQQAAAGLAEAHKQGILHRDVKPDNLLLAEGSIVKVLDFGLARSDGAGESQTRAGTVLGTPGYMAPEQARGEKVGAAADVYAMGVTLFELLTGKLPYPSTHSAAEIIAAHGKPAPDPRTLRESVPPALAAIVDKALQRDPAARQKDMAELEKELKRFCSYADSKTRRSEERLSGVRPAVRHATVPIVLPPPPPRRWPVAAAVTAVVLLAVAAWALMPRPAPPPPVKAEAPPVEQPPVPVPKTPVEEKPVEPLTRVGVVPENRRVERVELAAVGEKLVLGWTEKDGRIYFRTSEDGGRRWMDLKSQPQMRASTRHISMVEAGGRIQFSFIGAGKAWLAVSNKELTEFSTPLELGPAAHQEVPTSIAARSGKLLLAWEQEPSPGRDAVAAAWADEEGRLLSKPRILYERERPGNRNPALQPQAAFTASGGAVLFDQRLKSGDHEIFEYVTTAPGPDGPWSPFRLFDRKAAGSNPMWLRVASDGRRNFVQWSEKEPGEFPGRWIFVGICAGDTLDVTKAVQISKDIGPNGCQNDLAISGDTLWSVWEERSGRTASYWSMSRDGGHTWTKEKQLVAYKRWYRPAALAVTRSGRCWAAWPNEAGGATATPLP